MARMGGVGDGGSGERNSKDRVWEMLGVEMWVGGRGGSAGVEFGRGRGDLGVGGKKLDVGEGNGGGGGDGGVG